MLSWIGRSIDSWIPDFAGVSFTKTKIKSPHEAILTEEALCVLNKYASKNDTRCDHVPHTKQKSVVK